MRQIHKKRRTAAQPLPSAALGVVSSAASNPAGLSHVGQHFHRGRIVVIEEQTLALVQLPDGLHIPIVERKVEHIQILLHPPPVGGLGDHHHVRLDQEAQRDLRGGLAVLCADLVENRIGEEIVPSLRKGL